MPALADISFSIGESWVIELFAHDSCRAVLNITGAEVLWRLALDGETVTTLSVGDGVTIVDGPAGQALITLTPAEQLALALEPAFYQHECQVILPGNLKTDQFAGTLEAKPSLFPAS